VTHLSPHFSLEELAASATAAEQGFANVPDAEATRNLRRLAFVLEEAREVLGCPLVVSSGYRSRALNAVTPGASKTSAHCDGRAADFHPATGKLDEAFDRLRRSTVLYDQLIREPTWLHLGIARLGAMPRREALIAHRDEHGAVTYAPAPPIAA
jgi:hypothetical protein